MERFAKIVNGFQSFDRVPNILLLINENLLRTYFLDAFSGTISLKTAVPCHLIKACMYMHVHVFETTGPLNIYIYVIGLCVEAKYYASINRPLLIGLCVGVYDAT